MKRIVVLTILVLFAVTLMACTPSAPADELLKPGDKIGEMTVNKLPVHMDLETVWLNDLDCDTSIQGPAPATKEVDCEIPALPYVFLNAGMKAERWEDANWEIYIDGKRVDLEAFGTLDVDSGLRFWNLAIENLTPGTFIYRYKMGLKENAPNMLDLTANITVVSE